MFTYCLHPGIKDRVKKGAPTNRILVTHALKLCKRSESSRSKQIGCFKTFLRKTIHPQTCPSARGIWREHSRAPTCGKSSFTSAQSTAGAVPEASVDAGLQNLENVSSSEDWLGHKDNKYLKLGMAEFFCFFWQGAWRPWAHKFMMQKYYWLLCASTCKALCVFWSDGTSWKISFRSASKWICSSLHNVHPRLWQAGPVVCSEPCITLQADLKDAYLSASCWRYCTIWGQHQTSSFL